MSQSSTVWAQECCDRYVDPVSGALVVQLTSSSRISNNIYCEQPYTSPCGRYVAILRKADYHFDEAGALLVADLEKLRVGMIEPEGVTGMCIAAWSGLLVYSTRAGQLKRVNLATQAVEVLQEGAGSEPARGGSSVSPDQRFMVHADRSDPAVVRIIRTDLTTGESKPIFEHPDITNPHLQFNPVHGRDILVQHNRGSSSGDKVTALGTTLFLIDQDGGNLRELPIGPPDTASCTGHECFVADTGRVAFTVAWDMTTWRLDASYPLGNLFTVAPGEQASTPLHTPDHRFNHLCVSRCGKYFVADSWHRGALFVGGRLASCAIVVGNLQTGRCRVLVDDSMASGGGNQATHAHPYLTADNRAVIFNADPHYSTPQVFAARIPEGFLDSLA